MNVQIFKTPAGDEMVVIAKVEFDALLARIKEAEEDAADVAAYDAAKSADDGRDYRQIPPNEIAGHYLRMCRKSAGLTQAKLAEQTELAQGYISDLESGRRVPSIDAWKRISATFAVSDENLRALWKAYGFDR